MDENNPMNYEVEPAETPQPQPEPRMQYGPQPPQYQYVPQPQKPKKKGRGKIVALVIAVAVLAAAGGSAVTWGINYLQDRYEAYLQQQEDVHRQEEEEKKKEEADEKEDAQQNQEPQKQPEPDPSYGLVKHELPENLPTNDTGKSLTLVQVYDLTVGSVVGISTESKVNAFGQEAVQASSGSGFILSSDGYIITNSHVVTGADRIDVKLYTGETYKALLVGQDSSFDIAVLKIDAQDLPAVSVGDSDKLKVGEEVVAIGNPLGELTFTMTNGILSALNREINADGNPQNMLQTNAAINSGNSGGPLFDMDGNVIGVTSAKYSGTTASGTVIEGLGFAIPINDALWVAYDLVNYGYVRGQAYLGVSVQTLTDSTAAYYGLPVGPRVAEVVPGSCAEKGGIQVGDIIVALNDKKIESHTALAAALKKVKAGDTVELTLFRAGAEMKVTVTLDEKPRQTNG